ncbi:HisA/HisF-related TIM barrel protein [Campylobacter lari]|uniref:imidazole glycerol-phosphate synthase n=1 Tax=Campylobacter lari (strain RM2100 / D67 / ATCC BAA-1060) TaxID=306263 RepID=B9KDK2_CAMLR|nr:HisA/HisF-related TIM barrel protein [Campylobacter lari]ACM64640.2 glycosyl amidation-associated protein WbuZ [Campylobacter lari RM2100]EAH4936404.1 imidazole glycerol phosphate synthase subunit HisF [Campylobacter lari]EAH6262903.1 imidazole glycerol phosphate synthase subunit HisF [Campylobacter lari]EAH6293330.1 imidazole glycerol phosphate synthase subunit HisF [Campylobacter lari]EAH7837450.1 imidazole glycerol phosphate synthase subunit HisF [Campylobacter lari]
MLKTRVIPCVLLKDGQLVKSINFNSFRTIGHLKSTARIYNARNVDELIILNLDEKIDFESLEDIANECFMPLSIGGGIKNLEDIKKILNIGADKISINSIALQNPNFIKEAANTFGSSCIVCSIDVKKDKNEFKVFNKKLLDINPLELALMYESLGAGEILLTSIDKEGSNSGYDLELLELFKSKLKIPLIINGGLSKPSDGVDAIRHGANALAGAYIFHFSQYTPNDIKNELLKNNIPVRIV